MMNINQTYKVINKSYKIISTDLVVNEIRTLGTSGGILAFAGKLFSVALIQPFCTQNVRIINSSLIFSAWL